MSVQSETVFILASLWCNIFAGGEVKQKGRPPIEIRMGGRFHFLTYLDVQGMN